jgi:4-hydroxy-tetrahydrodipicolinate synthase
VLDEFERVSSPYHPDCSNALIRTRSASVSHFEHLMQRSSNIGTMLTPGRQNAEELRPHLSNTQLNRASRIPVFSFQRGATRPKCRRPYPRYLRQAAEQAHRAGIELAIEVESEFWADTGANTAAIVQLVNHPAFGVNWDPGNAYAAGDTPFPDGYRAVKAAIRHVHFKDVVLNATGELQYVVEGDIDGRDKFGARQRWYDGYISIETHMQPKVKSLSGVERLQSFSAKHELRLNRREKLCWLQYVLRKIEMQKANYKGVFPAAILPMTADYEPDWDAYARYLDWLIGENAIGLAVNMDTGEGPQLTPAERRKAVEVAVNVANGRALVVAGVMGATTRDAIKMSEMYKEAGADGLVVFPNAAFRNDPLDPSIPYEYHRAIADATHLPIILFQLAPVFGGVNFSREVLLKMLEIPEVVAIKEASFDAQYFSYTMETIAMSERQVTVLTGNDRFIAESFLLGAEGALLGFCAIGCRMVAELLDKFHAGQYQAAVEMRSCVQGFADFIYKNPVLDYRARCKVALAHVGVIERDQTFVRPPMLQIGDKEYEEIGEAVARVGMIPVAG